MTIEYDDATVLRLLDDYERYGGDESYYYHLAEYLIAGLRKEVGSRPHT